MAKKINVEIEEAIAGGATVVEGNQFVDGEGKPLRIRSMENTNDPLEVGDVITIPEEYKVLSIPVGETHACFIFASCVSADGTERNVRFFPNCLAKIYFPVDENKRRMPKVKTGGAVARWWAEQLAAGKDVNGAMQALKGRKIQVTAKDSYTVFKFQSTTETQGTSAYTYDWAE